VQPRGSCEFKAAGSSAQVRTTNETGVANIRAPGRWPLVHARIHAGSHCQQPPAPATPPPRYRSPCWSSLQQEGALLSSLEPGSTISQGTLQRKPPLRQPERCSGRRSHLLPARAAFIALQSHRRQVPTLRRRPPASPREDVTHHSPKGHMGSPPPSRTGALCPLEADPGLGHCPQLPQPRGRRRGHGFVPTHKR